MNGNIAAMVAAVGGNAVMNVGQSVQKMGSRAHARKRPIGRWIWASGLLLTSLSTLLILWAVSLGDVSLVGAMAGTGLPFMVLFSLFVLKEPAGPPRRYAGILLILVSAAVIGFFKAPGLPGDVRLDRLWALMTAVAAAFAAVMAVMRLRTGRVSGALIASLSGSLRGLVPLWQKVAVSPVGRGAAPALRGLAARPAWMREAAASLANPFTLVWLVTVNASMVVFQFAHGRGTAIRNIPSFTVAFVLMPVLGGMLCFAEPVSPVLLAGVAGIVGGNVLVARDPTEGRILP